MNKNTVKAINPKHQSKVNKFIKFNKKYDDLVAVEKDETTAAHNAYSKALDAWSELPKREQSNIEKHIEHVKGSY